MNNLTYEEFIQNILNVRGRFSCGEEYHERHHIIPKSMGGVDNEENFIDLYAKEHFEAHRLLALENPDNDKLIYAWTCMAFVENKGQKRYKITAEEYEEAKVALSKVQSVNMAGSNNPFYGRTHTKETRDRLREANKMRGYTGKNNPWFGHHHTEETKAKMKGKRPHTSGGNNHHAKSVLCIDTKMIYDAVSTASQQTGISRGNICSCCVEERKYAGGYQWRYIDDTIRQDGTIVPGAITLGIIKEEDVDKLINMAT